MNDQTTPPQESPWAALARPFSLPEVQVKVIATNQDKSRGLVVPFVDSRAIQSRLDEVVGPEGWVDSYDFITDSVVRCRLTVLGFAKEDVGLGTDAKSSVSDALKRAAVKFGINRGMYDSEKVWVALDQRGQIADPVDAKRRVLRIPSKGTSRSAPEATRRRPRSSDELVHSNGDLPF